MPPPGNCSCSGRTKGPFGAHSCYRPAHPPRPCSRTEQICSLHSPGRGRAGSGDGPALFQSIPAAPWFSSATRGSRSKLQGLMVPETPKQSLKTPLSGSPDPGLCCNETYRLICLVWTKTPPSSSSLIRTHVRFHRQTLSHTVTCTHYRLCSSPTSVSPHRTYLLFCCPRLINRAISSSTSLRSS